MTPADAVTILRTLLVFVVAIFVYYAYGNPYLVASALLLAFLLDSVDGYVARHYHCETIIGSLLDVVGDRITEIVLWLTFLAKNLVPLWAPVIILSRAVVTDALRSRAASKGVSVYGMVWSKLGQIFVSSRISRGAYGASKAVFFIFLVLLSYSVVSVERWVVEFFAGYLTVYSIVRGIPVLLDAKSIL